jgi:predicted RNase H-like HicB family nuclease
MDTYSIRIVWSDEEGGYIATSPEFKDLSAFGASAQEAAAQLESVVLVAVETYRASGWTLPEPKRVHEHSGQLRVRLPKSLHGRLADEAERDGVSLNTLIVTLLSVRAGETTASRQIGDQLRSIVTVLGEAVHLLELASMATAIARDAP